KRVESSADEESLGEEDASKQGRKIAEIDADKGLSLIDETTEDQGRINNKEMFDTYVLNDEEMFAKNVDVAEQAKEMLADKDLINDITLAKALMEIKVTSAGIRPKAKSIVMQEPTKTPTTTTIPISLKVQDKGKGIMVKEPLKMKKKDQISFDEQEARRLQAEINEEDRLAEEKAQQIEYENLAWDNVQAMIDADYELAARLQEEEQGELTVKEKSRLFVELMDKRKNSKRERDELDQERSKKKKAKDDRGQEELKQCLEIFPDDGDDVTIDATPLSIKTSIIDYKIYKEGKKSYFQIFRVDGNSQMYLTFSKMLKNFDREDQKVIWRFFKGKFVKIKPVDGMDSFLLHTLKTMYEHHVEDNIWRNQQGLTKVKNWKLFDSCGVNCVTMQNILYYLLVEKMYPLTNHTLHQMFNNVKR
nr:hypothetical protein [Tanacetum cinerariifolium]GFB59378.1 hypothetical protein [Tanacetum cinerariifolium]